MTDREKLIELMFVGQVLADAMCDKQEKCDKCQYKAPNACRCGFIADRLIANGVTVQEWISVKDRLPEDEGWYQVYTAPDKGYKSINKARFCKGFEWDNFTPHWHGAGGTWGNVTHWMPLPQPPKGE